MVLDASFWLMVSFVLLAVVGGGRVYRLLKQQLVDRSDVISRHIREISDLHNEAQTLYFRERTRLKKTRIVVQEAIHQATELGDTIVADAKEKVEMMRRQQKIDLDRRFALMENKLMLEIQEAAAEKICSLTEGFVLKKLTRDERDIFVQSQIKHIKLKN